MSKVYVFLADGFEEIEGLMVVDLLRRANIDLTTVSIMGKKCVTGRSDISVMADCLFEEVVSFDDGDMLVLPGGMPGTAYLEEYKPLQELIRTYDKAGKRLAAICAAPTVYGKMGLLDGKNATCYPGMEGLLIGAKPVTEKFVTDGNYTTSRGLGTAIEFSLELIRLLSGSETADQVAKSVVFQ